MVNKVTVNPSGVRGAGNIVSPKSLSDFNDYNSKVSSASETVNGATMTVYTVSYVSGAYFVISSESIVPAGVSSFVVTATLKRKDTNAFIPNAEVTCTVNDDTVLTAQTNSNGVVSFTIEADEDTLQYIVKLRYGGATGLGGGFEVTRVLSVDLDEITVNLTGDKTIIQSGETLNLTATVTGVYDGVSYPLKNKLVEFFIEE